MSKFQVGDRVVLLRSTNTGLRIGDTGVVYEIVDFNGVPNLRVDYDRVGRRLGLVVDDFEFENIYNSPLYKALL